MRRHIDLKWLFALLVGALLLLETPLDHWIRFDAMAQTADVRNTRHNLGSFGPGAVKTTATGDVCVFCHTPHGSIALAAAPLWNRTSSPATSYTAYSSLTLDGTALASPGASSKLCLSCHDGTLAPGSGISNTPGSGTKGTSASMTMTGGTACSAPGNTADTNCIPAGTDGQTRRLGTDLSNDHPIALAFTSSVATADTELRTPPYTNGTTLVVGLRQSSNKPKLPLMGTSTTDQAVECNSCHDPHLKYPDANIAGTQRDPGKFLRLPRFQKTAAPTSTHSLANDQVCVSCHLKAGWVDSAHATSITADEAYTDTTGGGADAREFPRTTKVWEAGCLNCHDTHTNTGARRLLRNGVSAGASAIENTCFQCHNTATASVLGAAAGATGLNTPSTTLTVQVPDIASDFVRSIRMPLTGTEVHEIRNSDFEECRHLLGASSTAPGTGNNLGTKCNGGVGNNTNRHVECTDCHNPHRVRRGAYFYTASSNTASDLGRYRTHTVGNESASSIALNGNVISGVLRGSWGVEPVYPTIDATTTWPTLPPSTAVSWNVKRGDPGTATSVLKTESYLTREYQLCFKCHSNYAYEGTPPSLGGTGLTAATANGYNTGSASNLYTNQAGEFAAKANEYVTNLASLNGTHQCEQGGDSTCTPIGGSWGATATTNAGATPFTITNAGTHNHRGWHPVMTPTGRTANERSNNGSNGNVFGNMRAPWSANVGIQTMHCSDCHGSSNATYVAATASWTPGTGPNRAVVQ
ncbi:MAG TPA: cytochrome c3 family protein, partial [Rhodocyclaceae bacterium]|nr:cytochrome c3 family protein [Rhodocyclaceae bacterium]